MKKRTAKEIAMLIQSDSVVIPGGFGCCGHPDLLTIALSDRFTKHQQPTGLTLLFSSGSGDKKGKGLDKLAKPGLVKCVIGGFWGFCPSLSKLGLEGKIEAHNWPMGVISHLFRDMASGLDGHFSRIGLHTFVDPRIEGGGLVTETASLAEVVTVNNREQLYYPSPGADFALLRGTIADDHGNVSMSGEAALHDAHWQAMATRNGGGLVAVQVESVVKSLPADQIDIPGHLIDFIVVADDKHYPSYGSELAVSTHPKLEVPLAKRLIVSRASKEPISNNAFLNFGIGIPALIGDVMYQMDHRIHTSVESGVINGKPKEGISFGEATGFSSIVQQADLFSFYNGGGIDVAFLGFAEIDQYGNINASSFGGMFTGSGGFINIACSAKKLILCGTFTTKSLKMEEKDHKVWVGREGKIKKFVKHVQQITVATNHPSFWKKEIKIITERAVLSLHKGHITLEELTKGFSIEDIIKMIPFPINISKSISFIENKGIKHEN